MGRTPLQIHVYIYQLSVHISDGYQQSSFYNQLSGEFLRLSKEIFIQQLIDYTVTRSATITF